MRLCLLVIVIFAASVASSSSVATTEAPKKYCPEREIMYGHVGEWGKQECKSVFHEYCIQNLDEMGCTGFPAHSDVTRGVACCVKIEEAENHPKWPYADIPGFPRVDAAARPPPPPPTPPPTKPPAPFGSDTGANGGYSDSARIFGYWEFITITIMILF